MSDRRRISEEDLSEGDRLLRRVFHGWDMGVPAGVQGAAGSAAAVPVSGAYQDRVEDSTGGTTVTFTGRAVGAAATGRIVVVEVLWTQSASAKTISSATIGGVTATVLLNGSTIGSASSGSMGLIYAVVPTGTTADVAITMSASVSGMAIAIHSIYDAASPTPVYSNAVQTTASGDTISDTLSYSGTAFCVAMASYAVTAKSTVWTNATEDFDDNSFDGVFSYSAASALQAAATITATFNTSSSTRRMMVLAAWQ